MNGTFIASPLTSSSERGYTLIALLAVMAVLAIGLTAAAPVIHQQVQREKEQEAIRRGEEVMQAIRLFLQLQGRLPNSMAELGEGVSLPGRTKKLQLLRASSARDPLSHSGEWRLIRHTDPQMLHFARDVAGYIGQPIPPRTTSEPRLKPYEEQVIGMAGAVTLNTATTPPSSGGEDDTENSTGPFIGVASRSRRTSVLNYYGIDHHDGWVFTPLFR